jgi:hypothetical protein
MLLLSIAKWHNLLNSQSPVYVGDEQTPPDLLNLLPEGIDSDPDVWLTPHKSIPAFPHRNTNRRSFGSKKIFLEEFIDIRSIYQNILDRVGSYTIYNPFIRYSFLHFKSD